MFLVVHAIPLKLLILICTTLTFLEPTNEPDDRILFRALQVPHITLLIPRINPACRSMSPSRSDPTMIAPK